MVHQPMEIAVEPGSDAKGPAPLDPENEVTRVAIHATEEVDPSTVAMGSLSFGPAHGPRAHAVQHRLEDVDDDGSDELLVHFSTREAGFEPDDQIAVLRGLTKDGVPLVGSAAVDVVGAERKDR